MNPAKSAPADDAYVKVIEGANEHRCAWVQAHANAVLQATSPYCPLWRTAGLPTERLSQAQSDSACGRGGISPRAGRRRPKRDAHRRRTGPPTITVSLEHRTAARCPARRRTASSREKSTTCRPRGTASGLLA